MGTTSIIRRGVAAASLLAIVGGATLAGAPAASAAAPGPLTLSAATTGAGVAVTVGGTGCTPILGVGQVTGAVVKVGSSVNVATFSATPNAQGVWSSPLVVPPGSTPGLYTVTALCVGLGLPYVGVSLNLAAPSTTTTPIVTLPPITIPVTTAPPVTVPPTTAKPATTTTVRPGVVVTVPKATTTTEDDDTTTGTTPNSKTGDDGTSGTNGTNGSNGTNGAAGAAGASGTGASGRSGSASARATSDGSSTGSTGSGAAADGSSAAPGELASRDAGSGTELLATGASSNGARPGVQTGSGWQWWQLLLIGLVLAVGVAGIWFARFRHVQVAGWWRGWMNEHTGQRAGRRRK